jgi:hypothetical protein
MHSMSKPGGSGTRKRNYSTSESGGKHLTSESAGRGSGGDKASLYRDAAIASVSSCFGEPLKLGLGRSNLQELLDLVDGHDLDTDESPLDAEPAEPDSCCPTWRDWGGNSFPSYHDVEADEASQLAAQQLDVTAVAAAGRGIWQKWDERAEHEKFVQDGASIGAQLRATAKMLEAYASSESGGKHSVGESSGKHSVSEPSGM